MQCPELAVQELERCMKQLGFAGVQIGSHINDWTLDRPELSPVFEACERLGAAIFVHPWDMIGTKLMNKYWLPWLVGMPAETCLAICSMIFGGVFSKFPKLRVCFAHGGGSFPGTLGTLLVYIAIRMHLARDVCMSFRFHRSNRTRFSCAT
jgi:aminocarboxymuconate-semialdehyde decarboxylase